MRNNEINIPINAGVSSKSRNCAQPQNAHIVQLVEFYTLNKSLNYTNWQNRKKRNMGKQRCRIPFHLLPNIPLVENIVQNPGLSPTKNCRILRALCFGKNQNPVIIRPYEQDFDCIFCYFFYKFPAGWAKPRLVGLSPVWLG